MASDNRLFGAGDGTPQLAEKNPTLSEQFSLRRRP
jgi:hypothetical protein